MSLTLLDWRRRMAALYAQIRASSDIGSAHQLWCDVRNDLFARHPDSPLLHQDREGFTGLAVAAYDPAYRFEADLDEDVPEARIEVATGTDGLVAFERVGRVHLGDSAHLGDSDQLGDSGHRGHSGHLGDLDVWWLASYGGGLFVPVKDALAGGLTYGGGRYLIDTVKGADLGGDAHTLVIDLNFAYNPSCAYDPAWACPLAPPGNVLRTRVMAGELTGHHHRTASGEGAEGD